MQHRTLCKGAFVLVMLFEGTFSKKKYLARIVIMSRHGLHRFSNPSVLNGVDVIVLIPEQHDTAVKSAHWRT